MQRKYKDKKDDISEETLVLFKQACEQVLNPSDEFKRFQAFTIAENIQSRFKGEIWEGMQMNYQQALNGGTFNVEYI